MDEKAFKTDEALFEELEKKRKKKKRRKTITVIVIVAIAVIAIAAAVLYARGKVRQNFADTDDDYTEYTVAAGSVSTTVSGSGTLKNVDEESITVPDGVEIDEIIVSANDKVKKGDTIATVEMSSVLSTMVEMQDTISEIDEKIDDARSDTVSSYISSGAEGTITKLYAGAGDKVADVMAKYGCLGEITVKNGETIRITGLAGTVSYVYLSEGSKVYNGTVIFSLTDTYFSANYDAYVKEREEKEELLLKLVKIYDEGAITAPYDGSISSIDYDEDTDYSEQEEFSVVTMSPDIKMETTISIDESNILSLELGQTAKITVSSIGDDSYSGEVTEINKIATSSSGVTRYTAVVTRDKTEDMLPGMTAKVVINIQGVEDALIIPVDALHQTSSTSYVYTTYDEETGTFSGIKEVEAGITNSNYAEIISGLNEGDTVYYTESDDNPFAMMDFGGGNMPDGGDFGGGMPGGGGQGGGMPGGGGQGGGMPGGGR